MIAYLIANSDFSLNTYHSVPVGTKINTDQKIILRPGKTYSFKNEKTGFWCDKDREFAIRDAREDKLVVFRVEGHDHIHSSGKRYCFQTIKIISRIF